MITQENYYKRAKEFAKEYDESPPQHIIGIK